MRIIKDAVLMPLTGNMDSFSGGLFDAHHKFIDDSINYRGIKPEYHEPIEFKTDTYIYGGYLFAHFGHFIWESLDRLPIIRKCKDYPILFISPNERVYKHFQIIFKSIAIRNNIQLIKNPCQIKNLIYCSPHSSIKPLFLSDEQVSALAIFDFHNQCSYKKVWLSRSRLIKNRAGTIKNEKLIEKILQLLGFKIIHPEYLPIVEQVRIISCADVIAGFDGSQFFSVLFAKSINGVFHIFNRRKKVPETLPYSFERKNITYMIHNFKVDFVNGDKSMANCEYEATDVDKIIDVLSNV